MSKIAGGITSSDFILFKQSSTISPIPAGAGLNRTRGRGRNHPGTDPRRRGAQPAIGNSMAVPCIRSPQARGSTGGTECVTGVTDPIPAGAGLNRTSMQPRLPLPSRSPQARGSTDRDSHRLGSPRPIPAGAGLNHLYWQCAECGVTDPRRRGAQPTFSYGTPRSQYPIPAGAGLNLDIW